MADTGPGSTCYTCDLVHQKSTPAEVWYDKVERWLCLRCHLAERKLQKFKGKGTIERIFQNVMYVKIVLPPKPRTLPAGSVTTADTSCAAYASIRHKLACVGHARSCHSPWNTAL